MRRLRAAASTAAAAGGPPAATAGSAKAAAGDRRPSAGDAEWQRGYRGRLTAHQRPSGVPSPPSAHCEIHPDPSPAQPTPSRSRKTRPFQGPACCQPRDRPSACSQGIVNVARWDPATHQPPRPGSTPRGATSPWNPAHRSASYPRPHATPRPPDRTWTSARRQRPDQTSNPSRHLNLSYRRNCRHGRHRGAHPGDHIDAPTRPTYRANPVAGRSLRNGSNHSKGL